MDKTLRDTRSRNPVAGTTIVVTNDFHGSQTTCRVRADGTISARTYRRVCRDLCGVQDCTCGRIRQRTYLFDVAFDDRPVVVSRVDPSYA